MKYLSKLLVVALCLVCGAAQAQTFVVSGQVVDSKTRKPIEFATVQLLNSSNKMVTGMNTDAKGRFVLKTKAAGKYTAKASYVTYKSMEKSVTLSAERDSVDLGLYELVASDVSLNTAVVSATVARVEQKEKAQPEQPRRDDGEGNKPLAREKAHQFRARYEARPDDRADERCRKPRGIPRAPQYFCHSIMYMRTYGDILNSFSGRW